MPKVVDYGMAFWYRWSMYEPKNVGTAYKGGNARGFTLAQIRSTIGDYWKNALQIN